MRKPEQLVAAPEQLAAGQERVIGGPDKAIAAPDMWIISREMSIGSGDKSMWRQEMTSRPPASAPRAPYPSIRLVNHTPRPTGSATLGRFLRESIGPAPPDGRDVPRPDATS
jgi:hypothetical protein